MPHTCVDFGFISRRRGRCAEKPVLLPSIAFNQVRKKEITFLPPEALSVLARSLLSLLVDLERLPLSLSLERGESGGLALLLCFEEPVRNRQQPG